VGGPNTRITNPRWWKNQKIAISWTNFRLILTKFGTLTQFDSLDRCDR